MAASDFCIGPPYYCSVFKDQHRIAAATAIISCFAFKVKLFFQPFFYFQTSTKYPGLLLVLLPVAVGRYSNMFSVKVSS